MGSRTLGFTYYHEPAGASEENFEGFVSKSIFNAEDFGDFFFGLHRKHITRARTTSTFQK